MNKKLNHFGGLVFSTNPDAITPEIKQDIETLNKNEQQLKVRLETKHRGGKTVTLIENFIGNENDEKELGKLLKTKCGTGGSVKDGEILIQGNYVEKVKEILRKEGYKVS
ncbi:MAG: translation initiation factor [Chitinophagaceae bacterium]|nr:translation initiation factor [Chitinophagaceae bacterium]